jgi:hypothetical protein
LAIGLLPDDATLEGLIWLEKVVLPTAVRVLPKQFLRECWRLASIDTSRSALEEVGEGACDGCRSLAAFAFPRTVRSLGHGAFAGTAMVNMDLSGTVIDSLSVAGMTFLADLLLPRRCVLTCLSGVPSLRRVTFTATEDGKSFVWHPTEVRFEGLTADADFSPGLLEARVYSEVACELGRETIPFPPP